MAWLIRLLDKLLVAQAAAAWSWARVHKPRRAALPPPAAAPWVAIKLVGMGDAVLMLPALEAMSAARGGGPAGRLLVVTTRRCAQVFLAPGVADEVIVLGGHHAWRQLRALWKAMRGCGGVLDFEQHVFWSCPVALLAPRRALLFGFKAKTRRRNWVYDRLVDPGPAPRPMKAIFDELATCAGFHPRTGLMPLPVGAAALASVDTWLAAQALARGRYAVLAPGSGATVAFRRLPPESWAAIIRGLPPGLPVVMAGTRLDGDLIAEIEALSATVREERRLVRQLGFNLQELAHLLAGAWKVVATDSGPMHLAAAMGVPVVGIFGPDTPRRYGPPGPTGASVSLNLPCSPCNNCWVYREARCTNPDRYACIRHLPPALVLETLATIETFETIETRQARESGEAPKAGAAASAGPSPGMS